VAYGPVDVDIVVKEESASLIRESYAVIKHLEFVHKDLVRRLSRVNSVGEKNTIHKRYLTLKRQALP
jgi:hypothetical protein